MNGLVDYADCHWPGLYSIALGRNESGGVSRLFVAKPGELCEDLRDARRPFLHHAHAYDFLSTTVAGVVENDVFSEVRRGPGAWAPEEKGGEKFHAYRFGSVMSGTPSLEWENVVRLRWVRSDLARAGERYYMKNTEIHRVIFHPDPRTGWFAVRLDEGEPKARPALCFAREYLHALPHEGELYRPIQEWEARRILDDLANRQGIEVPCL